jgi:GT2 family glycosyltransferase
VRVAVVVPVWNGRRWLEGLFSSLDAQQLAPDAVVAVDNGSSDGSVVWLRERGGVEVIELGSNTGFAAAANRGIAAVHGYDAVALVNTDIVLEADWLARVVARLDAEPRCASVACKMVDLADPGVLYDTGNFLRRDGVCEQRGRFRADDGRFDEPGEVWGACAGAALYRRDAVLAAGGFDERYFAYIEDVDLALRLRMAGWRCAYEPAVARHAGGGSSQQLRRPVATLVERNTLMLVARAFPWRWAPLVLYRQIAWGVHAARSGGLRGFLRGLAAGLARAPAMWRERRGLRALPVGVVDAVPPRPWRGTAAGGHRRGAE